MSSLLKTRKSNLTATSGKLSENFKQFTEWYESFCKKHGSRPEYIGKDFFDDIQNNHAEIRKVLGGIRTNTNFELKEVYSKGDEDVIFNLTNDIYSIFPNYFYESEIDDVDFLVPKLPCGMKCSKHVLQYARDKKVLHSYDNYRYDSRQSATKALEKVVEKLGQEWSKCKVRNQKLTSTITTAAKAFILLGHYGPDSDSCFYEHGSNRACKLLLASCKNSFVFLARDGDSKANEPEDSKSTLARMWGWFNPKDRVVNFCNLYADSHDLPTGNIRELCKLQSAKILGVNPKDVKLAQENITINADVYHNECENDWSFYTGDKCSPQVLLEP